MEMRAFQWSLLVEITFWFVIAITERWISDNGRREKRNTLAIRLLPSDAPNSSPLTSLSAAQRYVCHWGIMDIAGPVYRSVYAETTQSDMMTAATTKAI
jgi:hypothetical protein